MVVCDIRFHYIGPLALPGACIPYQGFHEAVASLGEIVALHDAIALLHDAVAVLRDATALPFVASVT